MEKTVPAIPQSDWLVVRLSQMGDIILTTGVLEYWGKKFGYRFDVLTKREWAPLYKRHPYVGVVHELSTKQLVMPGILSTFRQIAETYRGRGLIDLHGTLRSRFLGTFWHGQVVRYPKFRLERQLFLTAHSAVISKKLCSLTVPQRYALALEKDAPAAQELLPRLWLSEIEHEWAHAYLAPLVGEGVRPVALHPFASHALKTWRPGMWQQLAEILDERSIPWFSLGMGTSPFAGRKQDVTGHTSLRESAALLAASAMLVTGDSGPMHLASAVGTPVIGLFGPTTREWGFYPADDASVILEVPLSCRPCSLHGRTPCPKHGECLASISVEQVADVIATKLASVQ